MSGPLPSPGKRVLTRHRFQWAARRARRRWMASVRGRDAYVYRRGFMRYEVSYIDYQRPWGPRERDSR
jgi:hypothetical protein